MALLSSCLPSPLFPYFHNGKKSLKSLKEYSSSWTHSVFIPSQSQRAGLEPSLPFAMETGVWLRNEQRLRIWPWRLEDTSSILRHRLLYLISSSNLYQSLKLTTLAISTVPWVGTVSSMNWSGGQQRGFKVPTNQRVTRRMYGCNV